MSDKYWLLLIIITLGVIVFLSSQDASLLSNERKSIEAAVSKREAPKVKVITQKLHFSANDRVFESVGTGRAQFSADIYPAISEEVLSIEFAAQDHVKKGQLLVQLDDREEQLAVKLAEVRLKDAKSLLERFEMAGKEGAVPESEVDTARANFEAAEVTLEQAKLDVEEHRIIAPFDGYVGIPNVDPGDRVTTSTLITGLDNREILQVDFEVPEALAGALKNAQSQEQSITAITPSYPDQVFEGKIVAQESRVNAARRTLMARANIENKGDLLRPGMSFTTRWEIPGGQFATVPEISLQWGRDGSYVWVIRGGKAERVSTKMVARKAGQVLLEGDMAEGELIVVEGVQRLRPNIAVEVVEDAPS